MSMRWYVARRLGWTAFATFVILSFYFALIQLAPGGGQASFQFSVATSGGSAEQAAETYKQIRGLTGPLHERYFDYMVNMATGDWGWSQTRNQEVITAIKVAYPYSLQYALPATAFSLLFGTAVGLYSATHRYTMTDYAGTFISFFGISIPNFWFGIMLILILAVQAPEVTLFGVKLLPLPVYYQTEPVLTHGWVSWENARQLIMPVIVLSTAQIAGQMRYSRATAMEYVNAEFVKTARAKGASDWRVLLRHIFRPALIPLMTIFIAEILGLFFAGAYLVEVIFQIPGLAKLSYDALIAQDTPLFMGTSLIPILLLLLGNLLQDISYTVLDPRIDYGDR
jgi:peptide/nickel transport system permease protein